MREPNLGWSYPSGCSGPPEEPELPEFDPCLACKLPLGECECSEKELAEAYQNHLDYLRDEAADAAREEHRDYFVEEEPFFDDNNIG